MKKNIVTEEIDLYLNFLFEEKNVEVLLDDDDDELKEDVVDVDSRIEEDAEEVEEGPVVKMAKTSLEIAKELAKKRELAQIAARKAASISSRAGRAIDTSHGVGVATGMLKPFW